MALSVISLLSFMARSLLDWRYVYPDFPSSTATLLISAAVNVAMVAGWVWALAAAAGGRRGAFIFLLLFNLLVFALALSVTLVFCPSPCPAVWPLGEITNWANLVFGLLGAISAGYWLRAGQRD